MYQRSQTQTVINRLNEPRKFIQVLLGPRQVGKSTIIKQVLEQINIPYLFYSADAEPVTYGSWISSCWANARRKIEQELFTEFLLVIDEIQKVPNWSENIKKEWDSDTMNNINIKVIVLGSSRIMLEKGLSESLMGRFEVIKVGHWAFREMHDAFGVSLDQYIFFGGFPGAASLISDEDRWGDYVATTIVDATIHKDILLNSSITKPALLRQTFELASIYSGELLAYNKMLGILNDVGNTTTLTAYAELLNHANIICGLPKYAADEARRRASIPKWQVYDNALKTVFLRRTLADVVNDHQLWGRIVESAVGAYILNQAYLYRMNVYYWRDGDKEVDFILQKGDQIVAIEVKSNATKHAKGLDAFTQRFHPAASFIVGESGFPLEEFFSTNLSKLVGNIGR